MQKGLITEAQLEQVIAYSRESGLKFGEAALKLGIISKEAFPKLFGPNFSVNFFHLDSAFFPLVTRNLFSPEFILEHGVLPLGFKKEFRFFRTRNLLNIGVLDPANKNELKLIEREAKKRSPDRPIHGLKTYLVLPDQFLEILEKIYKISKEELKKRDPKELIASLREFMEKRSA